MQYSLRPTGRYFKGGHLSHGHGVKYLYWRPNLRDPDIAGFGQIPRIAHLVLAVDNGFPTEGGIYWSSVWQ